MSKVALITGITGQDGAYLAEFLLNKGYEVHGIRRRTSLFNTARIDHLYRDVHEPQVRMFLHYGDMTDSSSLMHILQKVQPEEIRTLGLGKRARFYQASTSELFGLAQETPQRETTPFYPRSPYGAAKLYAHWITINYREAYGLYACNGILFNHESPIRGETFVSRKITRGLARIKLGMQDCLYLGNLDARRDWGHARDYVEAQWLMLQQPEPENLVIATGKQHSVREFVNLAAAGLDIRLKWHGKGVDEHALDASGKKVVAVDPRYFRPTEVDALVGDPARAKQKLRWQAKTSFEQIVEEMVREDLREAERDLFFNDPAPPEFYTLSLHDALPI